MSNIQDLDSYLESIAQAIYTPLGDLDVVAWVTPEPVTYEKRKSGRKLLLKPGRKWGNVFDCGWFHFTGQVPASAAGKKVVLLIDVNGELCVVDRRGNPVRGLTSGCSTIRYSLAQSRKRVLQFKKRARGGEKVDFWADAGCNDLFGTLCNDGRFKEARIAICNEQMRALYYDFEVLADLVKAVPKDSVRFQQILYALNEASLVLKKYTEQEAKRARRILNAQLKKTGADPSLTISAIGHAHLDLAWLWPIRETIRKGARTFATAIELMDRYPDYIFGASQPQLYQWMKDFYPSLYRKIKKKVAEGRWEVQGSAWVEFDTNIPGGESLVRQFLYGKRFWRDQFGIDVENLWLPDSFGFSGSLPQIMKKCQVDYFMTQKLSWNQFNKFPYYTFIWKGIDGSSVLAHMPPEETYSSNVMPGTIAKAVKNFRDKAVSDRCLVLFGIGDGGGGPGAEPLERLDRMKNLSGLPCVKQQKSLEFFKHIETGASKYKTWTGELYLERHRGTYTTQGRKKRYNRKIELALRQLELISFLARVAAGSKYPSGDIKLLWKEVLLYQFHDILPGSSIKRVCDETHARYEKMLQDIQKLTESMESVLHRKINSVGMKTPVVVSNSLSWERDEWLKIEGRWIKAAVPSMGYTTIDLSNPQDLPGKLTATTRMLENELLRAKFAPDGSIKSVYDKTNKREIIAAGAKANQLAVYDDAGDAWDIPVDYADRRPDYFKLVSARAEVDGPRAVLRQEYAFGKSKLTQEILLTSGSMRVDFVTKVDWKESQKMLRTSFPVDIHTNEATCEIQFGNLKRPTHRKTTWDMAKYEVCAQKFVDISQGDYGVAVLNDCKYGHKVLSNVLDLNLLRSTNYPDPKADRGQHKFTYSLYPHQGDYIAGGVVKAGYELNVPLRVSKIRTQNGSLAPTLTFINVDADNVVVEAVKKAEDSDELVVRLYEAHGMATQTTLHIGLNVASAALVDMMEENPKKLCVKNKGVKLAFSPFEIHTVKLSVQPHY